MFLHEIYCKPSICPRIICHGGQNDIKINQFLRFYPCKTNPEDRQVRIGEQTAADLDETLCADAVVGQIQPNQSGRSERLRHRFGAIVVETVPGQI